MALSLRRLGGQDAVLPTVLRRLLGGCAPIASTSEAPPLTQPEADDRVQSPFTSLSSFSDPAYDYMQQPYKRPPGRRTPALLKYGLVPKNHSSFNHNSYMDPVYDFMQENYDRPRGGRTRR